MPGQLGEIGQRLRAARDALGLSLTVAEEETRIRKKYLAALETGERDELPANEVYVKGFIRTYGNYLGMDGDVLVNDYKQAQRPQTTPQERLPADTVAATRTTSHPGEPRTRPSRRPARERPAGRSPVLVWGIGVVVALVGLAVMVLLWAPGDSAPPPATDPVTQTPTPLPAPPVRTEPAVSTPPPPVAEVTRVEVGAPVTGGPVGSHIPVTVSPGPINLTLTFRDRAWVSIAADGKPVVEGFFGPDQMERFSATEQMTVTVGWVEVVDFSVNGKVLGAVAREAQRQVILTARKP